jgi:hypothetical protein
MLKDIDNTVKFEHALFLTNNGYSKEMIVLLSIPNSKDKKVLALIRRESEVISQSTSQSIQPIDIVPGTFVCVYFKGDEFKSGIPTSADVVRMVVLEDQSLPPTKMDFSDCVKIENATIDKIENNTIFAKSLLEGEEAIFRLYIQSSIQLMDSSKNTRLSITSIKEGDVCHFFIRKLTSDDFIKNIYNGEVNGVILCS